MAAGGGVFGQIDTNRYEQLKLEKKSPNLQTKTDESEEYLDKTHTVDALLRLHRVQVFTLAGRRLTDCLSVCLPASLSHFNCNCNARLLVCFPFKLLLLFVVLGFLFGLRAGSNHEPDTMA